jgi:hypothetical protein
MIKKEQIKNRIASRTFFFLVYLNWSMEEVVQLKAKKKAESRLSISLTNSRLYTANPSAIYSK